MKGARTGLACLQSATRDLMARVSLAKQAENRAPDAIYMDTVDAREEAEQALASHVCERLGVAPADLGILSEMIGYLPECVQRRMAA